MFLSWYNRKPMIKRSQVQKSVLDWKFLNRRVSMKVIRIYFFWCGFEGRALFQTLKIWPFTDNLKFISFFILLCRLTLYCNILYRWPWRLMELIGRNGRRLGPSLCFLPTKFSSGEVANRTNYREPTPRQTLLVAWRRYVFILDEDPKIALLWCAYD